MLQTINSLMSIFNNQSDKTNLNMEMNRDIITKLKFITTFQVGEKIDCKNLKIEHNNFITPIKRYMFGDSRDKTINFLNNTINRSFEIIQSYCNSERKSEQIFCSNIISDLQRSITGLNNIKSTYKEDKLFNCSIDILIETINAKLIELKDKNPQLFLNE